MVALDRGGPGAAYAEVVGVAGQRAVAQRARTSSATAKPEPLRKNSISAARPSEFPKRPFSMNVAAQPSASPESSVRLYCACPAGKPAMTGILRPRK